MAAIAPQSWVLERIQIYIYLSDFLQESMEKNNILIQNLVNNQDKV